MIKSDLETFEIARSKAKSTDEREKIDYFQSELVNIEIMSLEAVYKIRANRISRGEQLKPLNDSQKKSLEAALNEDDGGLHPSVKSLYMKLTTSAEVLKVIAEVELCGNEMDKNGLVYLVAHDRVIEFELISRREELVNDLLAFIGDREFEIDLRRKALKYARDDSESGGELFVVLNYSNVIETTTSGTYLAKNFSRLESLADKIEVKPLSEYLCFDDIDYVDWYVPELGILTLSKLANHICNHETKIKDKQSLLHEMEGFTKLLEMAHAKNSKFHFQFDT